MSGTIDGGRRAAETNKAKYGEDFYRDIGSKGGRKGAKDGVIKGFARNIELAREAGRKGGSLSRRGRKWEPEPETEPTPEPNLLERIFRKNKENKYV